MTDAVAIAIATGVQAVLITIVGAVVTIVTRKTRDDIKTEIKKEAAITRQHVQTCCYPDDLPPRNSRPAPAPDLEV